MPSTNPSRRYSIWRLNDRIDDSERDRIEQHAIVNVYSDRRWLMHSETCVISVPAEAIHNCCRV